MAFLVIEDRHELVDRLRARGIETIHGNAAAPEVIAAANLAEARGLLVAIPDAFEAGQIVEQGRAANPAIEIIARAHSDEEVQYLNRCGADLDHHGRELEIARRMAERALDRRTTAPSPSLPSPSCAGRGANHEPVGSLGHEGDLGRGRWPAEDFVAVRKAAEALDDLDIGAARNDAKNRRDRDFAAGRRTRPPSAVGRRCSRCDGTAYKRTTARPAGPAGRTRVRAPGRPRRAPPRRSHRRAACRERCCAAPGRAAAPRRARPLPRLPTSRSAAAGGRLVIGEKLAAQRRIELLGALEPDLAVPLAVGIAGRSEPEIEQRLRPGRAASGVSCLRRKNFECPGG